MSAADDAFANAAGQEPGVIAVVATTIVLAIFVVLVARSVMGLWDCHTEGSLEGKEAAQHAMRLAVLMVFFMVVVLW